MPIQPFSEEEQALILDNFNKTKNDNNKIPSSLRNYNSGWPLLQVSLFTIASDTTEPIKYEHVLGGGNCHFFHIGAFNFASLLTKIPGNMDIMTSYPITPKRELVKADNVLLFLKSFSVHHKKLGIKISSKANAYGRNLLVELPVDNSAKFRDALADSFSFALKEHFSIKAIGGYNDSGYTEKQIMEAINPEVAVFINGQIFIDLGMLLEQHVKDKEIIELFKLLFKVEAFLELKKEYAQFKPASIKSSGATPKNPAPPFELRAANPAAFFQKGKETILLDELTIGSSSELHASKPNINSQK
ncbi:hypothetical protein LEAN103870_17165 [Legionella anisa]|uniref:Uncharacterized protein n=1 Tax=Legionella anisa TaxID=28082 RepID=A0AAX0WQJ2_9GAMM|nr:hypothetical protein [Legionella anisa]AWN75092.1 hypothetical protein DLD14_15290 [Legionella anisa]KTC68453.1 hypothetical protein Lani_3010 [Legionella anisa]MBN5934431.1 hypothetical protein [Legionella anisa]MCW8424700.1 hypothetical protein [Legionella anisa]MCW8446181.1 hypothetical protein [Legionella anisa]